MPNTGRTQKGSSLKRRLDTAARLTAEEQRARKSRSRSTDERASDSSSRSKRRSTEETKRASTGSHRHDTASSSSSRSGKRSKTDSQSTRHSSTKESSSSARKSSSRSRSRDAGESSTRNRSRGTQSKPKVQMPAFVEKIMSAKLSTRIIIGVVAFFVVAIVLLYPVGQTYYQSLREVQLLEARIDAEKQYNEAVSKKNEELQTDEGVEVEAREQLGLVKKGEQSAIVTNKDGSSVEGSDGVDSKLPNQVNLDDIEPPHTWYYDVLDVIFFVHLD